MTTRALNVLDAKLKSMSDAEIQEVWEALNPGWDAQSFWDEKDDITMTDWAEAIYSERGRRGLC